MSLITQNYKEIGNLSIKSTKEEVSQFFFENYKITEKVKENIIKESITGEILILLEDDDYTFLEIIPEIKDKIKKYLESNKNNFIINPDNITLKFESNKKETIEFCEKYLSFKGNLNDDINGKKLLTLSVQEMKSFGLNLGQRKKLINYIKYVNNNYKKELKEFLKNEVKLLDQFIEALNLNKDNSFLLIEGKIENSEKNKEIYKNKLKEYKEKILSTNTFKNENTNENENTNRNQNTNGNTNQYFNPMNNYILKPLDKDSKYNLFFLLVINEQNINNSFLSVYSFINNYYGMFQSKSYFNYAFNIINEERISDNLNNYRILLIQVPIEQKTETIFITYRYPSYGNFENYINDSTKIDINGLQNYFYINNLNYQYHKALDNNQIFTYFFNFFFDKQKNKEESLQISLMKALINKVNQDYAIILSPEIIFKYLKYCLNFKLNLFKIRSIIIENKNNKISKEYYISNEDINNMIINQYEKPILIEKIIDIYFLIGDIDYLIGLKKSKELGKAFLEKLNRINFDCSRIFNNEESLINFQNELLSFCMQKGELNYILNLSKGLTKYLKYIYENYEKIYTILINNAFDPNTYLLNLPNVREEDTLEKIKELLYKILEKKKKEDYNIINYGRILEGFITIYNKNKKLLNEYCNLKDIINICKKNGIELYSSEVLYLNIHRNGVNLINNNKMTIEEIIQFLYSQDIYYYDEKYKDIKETTIFKNISITDPNKNNLKNIEELKKKKVWELYKKSNSTLKIEFYKSFLCQIKYIKDFQYIFKLFPIENIEKVFNQMIIDKLEQMKIEDLDRENCDIIFEIYSKLLICNDKNKLDLKLISFFIIISKFLEDD